MSWGLRQQISELTLKVKRLEEWRDLALNILTDNQLDFKPSKGDTLRKRLREIMEK